MKVRLSDHFTYKKLIRAVLPTVFMMIFTSVYSVVDGFFVSNFAGKSAFVGVNFIMPVIIIVGAIGFMLGAGGSALVAKTLGEGNEKDANQIFSMIIYATVIGGVVISVLFMAFLEPLARLLGGENTTEETLRNAALYGKILLGFNTIYMLQNVFQSFFIVAEKATLGFIVTVIAGATNMVLDALFIVGFDWGVTGAAVATGIAQTVGAAIPVVYFSRRNSSLLRLGKTKFRARVLLKAATNGSSEFLSNVAMAVVGVFYNAQLLKYAGENGIAAYGVIMYAGFIFAAIFFGYSMGVTPLVGYHFGAQNHGEIKNLLHKSVILTFVSGLIMVILTETLAMPISSIFVGYQTELLQLATRGFRLYGISFALCGFCTFSSAFFTALNDGITSAFISFSRTLLFQIIFIIVTPLLFKIDGVWLSIVFSETCAAIVSAVCLLKNKKKYRY